MKTFTTLTNLFTNLTNNVSSENATLGRQLVNDTHRYLIQKYFANERTVQFQTVGGQNLTLTAPVIAGATSATLTAPWAYQTCEQLVTFSSGEQPSVTFTRGSSAITWDTPLQDSATTSISTVGVQYYDVPANVSKVTNDTINVGQLKYQPNFVRSRQEWDEVNFLPYTSDIPQYCFLYGGKLGIFPIPSTTGNIITLNYKTRVADLSFEDYSTGNIANAGMTAGAVAVTGLATNWVSGANFPTASDISYYNLMLKANPPYGDGIWYPIRNFSNNTSLTLNLPVIDAPNITAATTYTIGQMPLLEEDFHDMIVYGALRTYYGSINKDPEKYNMFNSLYNERLVLLEDYAGTKPVNVDLGAEPEAVNPNLFIFASN